jgi:hypothetical protein
VERGQFVLTLQDDRLSLRATEAPLQEILAEIGRQMHLDVRGEIPADMRVTLAFERLPLPEVLQRLGQYVNYASIARRQGKIIALRVYARHNTPLPAVETAQTPEPAGEPTDGRRPGSSGKGLDLEIDPRQFLQEPSR